MKVSKARASENRDTIVQAAAAQIRERGFDQMSMAEVARSSALTHGAVYSHFKSKEALQAEATRRAFEETARAFMGLPIAEFLERYLSNHHRDNVSQGCPNAALVSEVPRQTVEVQEAFRDGLQRFLAMSEEKLAAGETGHDRDGAIAMFATMVGGLALSRAVHGVDETASDEILNAVSGRLNDYVGIRPASPDR